jgi:hypothetical protein
MQLVILILLAGVIGYFFAKSRLSKPIDDAGEKVTQTTRDMADKTEGWVRGRFGRKKDAESEQGDLDVDIIEEEEVVVDEKKPAKKQTSRRKAEAVDQEGEETEEVEP